MDRTSFQLPFSETRAPKWPCPTCRVGHLNLVPKTLTYKETPQSVRNKKHTEWEPDWTRYVFASIFECSNSDCREVFSCSGFGRIDLFEEEDDEFGLVQSTDDRFTPMYFEPPLTLMDIPAKCPLEARDHLRESFALFFADPGASLNCARAAVEAVLTDLGVKRFVVAKGKRRSISLHQRILLLPPNHKEMTDLLLAAKWLGNAGSHDGEKPNSGDLRVMYDLLEHVLSEIYEKKTKNLKKIAKKVNKKKGPLK